MPENRIDEIQCLKSQVATLEELLAVQERTVLEQVGQLDEVMRRLLNANNELAAVAREREKALADLRESYWHLKKIQEVLSICMECGKIKAGETRWLGLVEYLMQNNLIVSHGYCNECAPNARERWTVDPSDGQP